MSRIKRGIPTYNPALDALEPGSSGSARSTLPQVTDVELSGSIPASLELAVDVTESTRRYVVSAELPGVQQQDVAIQCRGDVLWIHARKTVEREERKERGRLVERRYGQFHRWLRLPGADLQQAEASLAHGVLRLEIPRTPGTGSRRERSSDD